MNAIVKRIDGEYRLLTEDFQTIGKRSWRTLNGARRYAIKNGYTLASAPIVLNAAILTRTAGKAPYQLIIGERTFQFQSRNSAIQYCKSRFSLPIMDYTMNH